MGKKLFDADGEVRVGDVVRYNNKPCYVEYVLASAGLVGIVTMDERKLTIRVTPQQIGCVFEKESENET